MKLQSFDQIHSSIDAVLGEHDPTEYITIHPYKVIQHAISYELMGAKNKLIAHKIGLSIPLLKVYFKLRSLRGAHPKKITLRKTLMLDDGRTGRKQDGTQGSMYLSRLIDGYGRENVSILKAHSRESSLKADITSQDLEAYRNLPIAKGEMRVLRDVKKAYSAFRSKVDEGYLGSALQVFFEDFHKYYHFLIDQAVERMYLITHYHQEGLIAAARILGIEVIELQHGLIAREDLYYVYPDRIRSYADKCLFADKILVFGTFWKEVLLQGAEYSRDQIIVAGDYSLNADIWQQYQGVEKENSILLGTQKNMAADYIQYAEQLLRLIQEKHPDWQLWVKLHPLEKELEAYERLAQHPNCEVYGRDSNLMELLSKCKIQVSIYSTTFYDAIGLGVQNFSLQDFSTGSDYAASMVEQGVATALAFGDDPVEKASQESELSKLDRSSFYAPFSFASL